MLNIANDKLVEKLSQEPSEIGGRRVENINRMDGVKFLFENGAWMLMRPSGTEPLVRVMVEGRDETEVDRAAERIAVAVRQVAAGR